MRISHEALAWFTCEVCDADFKDHPFAPEPHVCPDCEDTGDDFVGEVGGESYGGDGE